MKNTYRQNSKISLALLISILLVGCGGGGSDNESSDDTDGGETVDDVTGTTPDDGTGIVTTPGTGTCVSITSPKVGDTSLIQNVIVIDGNSSETDVKTTYTAVSNTSWTYKSEITNEFIGLNLPNQMAETTETFTISNNVINFTESVTTSNATGVVTKTYSPARSAPINEVCEGQTFTQNYVETIVSIGGTDIENVDVENTIEAVNVTISVPAGTFNTYRVISEGSGINLTSWVDISSSTIVLMEFRDEDSNELFGTGTLLSLD